VSDGDSRATWIRSSSASAAPVADLHLKTVRLELRALTFGDLDELASMLADAEALTY
jgi:hypothetical protein